MEWYRVSYLGPTNGKTHSVPNMRRIPNGPTREGTIPDLYPGVERPRNLATLVCDFLGSERTGELAKMNDPRRLRLWSWGTMSEKHRRGD